MIDPKTSDAANDNNAEFEQELEQVLEQMSGDTGDDNDGGFDGDGLGLDNDD